jgi:hypothetical protein
LHWPVQEKANAGWKTWMLIANIVSEVIYIVVFELRNFKHYACIDGLYVRKELA